MTSEEATLAVIDALEVLGIPYMLVGSLASNVYGVTRSTQDADFVIEVGNQSVVTIANRLGPAFRLDPQMTFDTATGTYRHGIEVPGLPFQIELFHLSDAPHDQEGFHRRHRTLVGSREVFLPTAEDAIITILRWFLSARRNKDRDDATTVIAVQGDAIDWNYVHGWCDQHGTRELPDEIR